MFEIGQTQNGFCKGAFPSVVRLPLHERWPPCHLPMTENCHEGKVRVARDAGTIAQAPGMATSATYGAISLKYWDALMFPGL